MQEIDTVPELGEIRGIEEQVNPFCGVSVRKMVPGKWLIELMLTVALSGCPVSVEGGDEAVRAKSPTVNVVCAE